MIIRFSEKTQSFYPLELDYKNMPNDIVIWDSSLQSEPIDRQPGDRIVVEKVIIPGEPEVGIPDKESVILRVVKGQTTDAEGQKAIAISKVKEKRDILKYTGCVSVDGKWYPTDLWSRDSHGRLTYATIPTGLQWKTKDGTLVAMTNELARKIEDRTLAQDNEIHTVAEGHIAKIKTSTNPAAYDYSTGWPKMYGE